MPVHTRTKTMSNEERGEWQISDEMEVFPPADDEPLWGEEGNYPYDKELDFNDDPVTEYLPDPEDDYEEPGDDD